MDYKLVQESERQLREYLLSHEHDIAIGENDFGDLRDIFLLVFGREPE